MSGQRCCRRNEQAAVARMFIRRGWMPWALVTPALAVDRLLFRPAVHRHGRGEPARTSAAALRPCQLRAVLHQSELLARMVNSLEVTADRHGRLGRCSPIPSPGSWPKRCRERWQRLALMLAVLPFWTSYVVRSYSWLLVLARKRRRQPRADRLGLLAEPMQLANTRARHGDRLRAFLRHAADADDLRQSQAASARATARPQPTSAPGRCRPSSTSSCR